MTSPFAITAEADVLGAVAARLRTFTEITALTTADRIAGKLAKDWFGTADTADYAVRLRKTGGPVDADRRTTGQKVQRLDIWAYGSNPKNASKLMAYVLAALCPLQVNAGGFRQSADSATIQVNWIQPEAEVIDDTEPDTGWCYCWCPVLVHHSVITH